MSRLSFLLATTLLVIAGSLIFMMTFDRGGNASQSPEQTASPSQTHRRPAASQRTGERGRTASSRNRESGLSLPKSATTHLDQDQIKQVERILARTHHDARIKLHQLAIRYQLDGNQRREILPYLIAHHEQAHPAMMVNGQPLPSIAPGSTLEESISSLLDPSQKDALIEETIDDKAWWEDVVGQLESDLDTAINNGEMVPADDLPFSNEAAVGDGEASEHSGSNLFDLLGR